MPPRKRKLRPQELRLLLHKKHLKTDGNIKTAALIHVARLTVNGHVITACDGRFVSLLDYYYFPFLRFIYDNAQVCPDCVNRMAENGIPPCSNTGVNSELGEKNNDS